MYQLIQQIGGFCKPRITRQTIYTFHAAYAKSFAHKRVFLLGDAAHLLPPFGGQGMNCGLRDAHNLVWKLALVLRGQARPDILKTYQQERAPHVSQMIRFSSFLGRMIMTTSHSLAFLRDIAIRILMTLPPIASFLTEVRIKPESVYKHGLLLSDSSRLSRSLAGQLLPQPTVLMWGDKPVPLDEALGYGFALLRLYANPGEAFKTLQADVWQRLKPRYVCVVSAVENMQETCQNITCVLDSQQQIARFLRGHSDLFILVRPDRYVLGAFHVGREQAFAERLQKRLFPPKEKKFVENLLCFDLWSQMRDCQR